MSLFGFRDAYLGLWIAEDGKALWVERDPDPEARYPLQATIAPGLTAPPFPASDTLQARDETSRLPASWAPREPERVEDRFSQRRLDRLIVEAEAAISGRTYELIFSVRNTTPEDFGGFTWRPVLDSDPIESVRLHDETGAGFLDAVCYMEDEGALPWIDAYTIYHKARPEERARFLEHHPEVRG